MSGEIREEARRPRLRFSLLTLLLLTTIVSLGVALWRVGSEVVPLKEKVRRLRDEVGDLVVEDKTKFCAVQANTKSYLTWKWRIWIPPGKVYQVRCGTGPVKEDGFDFPHISSSYFRESGEHWVAYRIRRDPKDDKWYGHLFHDGGGAGKNLHEWVDWPNLGIFTSGVGHKTSVQNSDLPFELIRHRVKYSDDTGEIDEPCPGFLIWAEAEKKATPEE